MDLYVDNIEDILKTETAYNLVHIDMHCSAPR